MPKFNHVSFSRLSTCHLDLQIIFFEVIKEADCSILEGHRNKEDQTREFLEGSSKLQWPYGKHNSIPSMAVDVSPYPYDERNIKRFYWFAGYVMGVSKMLKNQGKISHSVRYGGDWDMDKDIDDQNFKDLVHFELV